MEPTVIYISSDSEDSDPEEPPESEDDDVSELLDAFEPLSISARLRSHRSLPFLVRNLRKSFLSHCQAKGISTGPKTAPTRRLRMVYKYFVGDDEVNTTEEDWVEHSGSSIEWICAFCDLHGAFNTRELLEYHLSNDHKEVETTWENKVITMTSLSGIKRDIRLHPPGWTVAGMCKAQSRQQWQRRWRRRL